MKTIKKQTLYITLFMLFAVSIGACKKIEEEPKETFGQLELEFDHVWGLNNQPFYLNQTYVHPMSEDTMELTMLKYYISNVVLYKTDGSTYEVPDSYYLIDPEENTISINNVPSGDYTRVDFIVGVDSARNNSGLQTGALNPSNGMFWSWSTGYIFIRVEGKSPQSSTGMFMFHLGGYEEPFNAINQKQLPIENDVLNITPNAKPVLHLNVNVAKLWHGPIELSKLNLIHNIGDTAVIMANNFSDGISIDHIHK